MRSFLALVVGSLAYFFLPPFFAIDASLASFSAFLAASCSSFSSFSACTIAKSAFESPRCEGTDVCEN